MKCEREDVNINRKWLYFCATSWNWFRNPIKRKMKAIYRQIGNFYIYDYLNKVTGMSLSNKCFGYWVNKILFCLK